MTFSKKMIDFHRIWPHIRPNFRQKDMRKSMSHFLQGNNKSMTMRINASNFFLPRSPCKKRDMNSHGNSESFPVTNRRQFGPNPHQIP